MRKCIQNLRAKKYDQEMQTKKNKNKKSSTLSKIKFSSGLHRTKFCSYNLKLVLMFMNKKWKTGSTKIKTVFVTMKLEKKLIAIWQHFAVYLNPSNLVRMEQNKNVTYLQSPFRYNIENCIEKNSCFEICFSTK